jgi:2,4-dienoyl-CoA reductase (NADPH2)
MPQVCEDILSSGGADLVSMARPFLADPEIINKSAANKTDEINTCIGCNQGYFKMKNNFVFFKI